MTKARISTMQLFGFDSSDNKDFLLRRHVRVDAFRKLKNSEGRFKEWVSRDRQGLLSLYEAAHLAFNGEDILDEALIFATKNLKSPSIIQHNTNPNSFQKQIDFALRFPAWKCVPRSLARHSIDFYSENTSQNQKLLMFAKMDFNMVQNLHQQELYEISGMNVRALQELPDRMKKTYRLILDLYDEVESEIGKSGPTFPVDYAKGELKKLCRAYLLEIRWRAESKVPTLEEYMITAHISCAMPITATSNFIGMGAEIATREAFEWVTNESKLMKACSVIGRLQNDIFSHECEQNRSHPASAVECYMKQHGATEEEAVEFLWKKIHNAWKDIVEEYQKPTPLPVALTDRLLNLARSFNLFYENGDGYTNSHLVKDHLTSMLIDPVPL
ncbi:unnamed protein product [Linum tenue]|uniref:Terpene synthase n=1 Tax=Linum tenue TaxID=586396 RepID=A0AAV0NF31_9ROSI|nr:unnamed protein product [Linum tenue]